MGSKQLTRRPWTAWRAESPNCSDVCLSLMTIRKSSWGRRPTFRPSKLFALTPKEARTADVPRNASATIPRKATSRRKEASRAARPTANASTASVEIAVAANKHAPDSARFPLSCTINPKFEWELENFSCNKSMLLFTLLPGIPDCHIQM